ncbi:MAG: caspase family protein [Desulfobacterales bacterium]|nr:caspase family protein [Desulfobacterales bacterium]
MESNKIKIKTKTLKTKALSSLFIFIFLFSFYSNAYSAQQRGILVTAKSAKGSAQTVHLYDYTVALIIGIDRYINLDSRAQLEYAVKDAKGVESTLRENYQFSDIITLYNQDATREKIMAALFGLRSLSPDAGVVVSFAGHGLTLSGALSGKDLGFLIPYDGKKKCLKIFLCNRLNRISVLL